MPDRPIANEGKRNLVIFCTDAFGDLVLRQPLFSSLLDLGYQVHVVIRKGYEQLLPFLDHRLDAIVTDICPEFPPAADSEKKVELLQSSIAHLEPELLLCARYTHTWLDEALMRLFPDLERLGFNDGALSVANLDNGVQVGLSGNIFSKSLACSADIHEAEKNKMLFHAASGLDLPDYEPVLTLPDALPEKVLKCLKRLKLEPGRYVLGCPVGTVNVPIKAWPVESFVELVVYLKQKHNLPTLITGLPSEAAVLNEIVQLATLRGVNVRGWIGSGNDLDLLLGLIQLSRLYLGGDTAPMHFAGALGLPVVALFGGGTWPRFLPLARRSFWAAQKLPCFGCNWHCWLDQPLCLDMVPVEKFMDGLDWILSEAVDEQRGDVGQPVDPWLRFVIERQSKNGKRSHQLGRLLQEAEADRMARLELIEQRGGEIVALREQAKLLEAESEGRLKLLEARGGEIVALQEQVRLLQTEHERRLELIEQRGGEIVALRERVKLLEAESEGRLRLLEDRGGEIGALREQVELLQTEHERRLELIEQRGGEIVALREQIEQIHHDGFTWLLTCATGPPKPFEFPHPAQSDLISVIIPAYNAGAFLERCVQSVWRQQVETHAVEIVFCDDGSTDGTLELALALQARSPIPLQVLTHPRLVNKGVSATRNLALQHSRGEFIALLDADDVWLPHKLAVQVDYLVRHEEVQCLCSLGYNRNLAGQLARGWNGTHIAGDYRKVQPPGNFEAPYTFEDMMRGDPVVNSTLLLRRNAIARAGGYPDLMAHQAEDWLLLTKISLEAPIRLLEEKLIDYTVHAESYTNQYVQQGFAYGVQIEFLYHLVHWMIRHPTYRELGERVFRQHYPRLIAARSDAYRLIEEYYLKHQQDTRGIPDFETHLTGIYAELSRLRSRYGYVDALLAPLWATPVARSMAYLSRNLKALCKRTP